MKFSPVSYGEIIGQIGVFNFGLKLFWEKEQIVYEEEWERDGLLQSIPIKLRYMRNNKTR